MKTAITISRQRGSGGREVGAIIAQRLGWTLVGREQLGKATHDLGVDEVKIENIFDRRPSLQARMTQQQMFTKYLDVITKVMKGFVDKGNVVLLGRGAHIILADDPRLFRIHLVADLEVRIQRVAKQCKLRGKKGMGDARTQVIDLDYARSAYHNYIFDADWNDPLYYELVLNTTDITSEQAASAILAAFDILKG